MVWLTKCVKREIYLSSSHRLAQQRLWVESEQWVGLGAVLFIVYTGHFDICIHCKMVKSKLTPYLICSFFAMKASRILN